MTPHPPPPDSISDSPSAAAPPPDLAGLALPAPVVVHGPPEDDRAAAASPTQKALDVLPFATHEHGYLWSNISFSEEKAAFVFAVETAILGYVASEGAMAEVLRAPSKWDAHSFLALACLGLLVVSLSIILSAVLPYVGGNARGLVFWGAVSEHTSGVDYVNDVRSRSDTNGDEVLLHCYELARICRGKYAKIRLAILIGGCGFLSAIFWIGTK